MKKINIITKEKETFSVVQIIDRLHVGGAERVLVTLSNLLYINNNAVSVVTTVSKGPLAKALNKEIPVIDLQRKSKWNLVTMYKLIRVVKKFDIIHVHSSYNLRYLFLAAKIFGLKKPIFFHEHFGDININQQISWHTKYIYPKTFLIAVSKQIADWAIQQINMPKERVFVLSNTVIKQSVKDIHDKKSEKTQLVIVSNIRPTKNIITAIKITEQLNKNGTPAELTIIGQIADKYYYDEIFKYINNYGLKDVIYIKTGETNIQHLLHQFDLALHTATSESGPLVLIEYIAQGLPFLTYETGEVVNQVKENLPLHIMSTFDINDWAERIMLLLQEDQNSIRNKMEAIFDKYYSAEVYYNKCIAIYEEGLKQAAK